MTEYGEEILRFTQDDNQYVILNEVKNLKVCETVESSTTFEILRFTQDDRVWRERSFVSLRMTEYSEEILRVAQDDRVCERDYRVGHALLAMTEQQKRVPTRKVGTHAY